MFADVRAIDDRGDGVGAGFRPTPSATETLAAWAVIDQVMAAQGDLVEIVHSLKQILCVKGWNRAAA
jgi:tRNA-splicing ligase RtcB